MIDNPVRGRFNAWLLDMLDGYMDRKYAAIKTRLFGAVPPIVVDLGAGSGANFRYFPAGTTVIAVEPNARMHDRLVRTAKRRGLTLQIHSGGGEALELADASVDLVCASLVLCTVPEPDRALAEVRRVLKPGARFAAVEHVAAPSGSGIATLQRTIRRPWRWVFEGCELCNHTESLVRAAGFREVSIEPLRIRTAFLPIRYQIAVTCVA
jgi:ubiquinone/menaquinone biosynthesis C-methylase UbiE